jgi:hypothetical protein
VGILYGVATEDEVLGLDDDCFQGAAAGNSWREPVGESVGASEGESVGLLVGMLDGAADEGK